METEMRYAEDYDWEADDPDEEFDDSDDEIETSDSDHRSRQAVSILRDLNVSSIGNLPRTICRLLSENSAWTWTDDDILDCVMRALQYRPTGPSKYWCIRKIDENTCYVELLDNSDGCTHATRSQDDPAAEFYELKKNIQDLSSLLHVTCTDVSRTCLNVQLPISKDQAVSRAKRKTEKTSAANRMANLVEDILDQGSPRIVHDINDVNQAFIDQGKRIKAFETSLEVHRAISEEKRMEVIGIDKINRALMSMEKRMKALEATNAELITKMAKLQFEKVLVEMKRKGFKSVLDEIAQAQREAEAARLGFGKVLHEMKKKGFARLLGEITASKRDAKAVELAKRLQQLQMEARAAGISLENIDLPIIMPEVVKLTGAVSPFSNSISLEREQTSLLSLLSEA